eukprot:PhF_6_TR16798/c0_g1_i1/m.25373/K03872/TCEB1; transcription elongation factor B, polypeptide 1
MSRPQNKNKADDALSDPKNMVHLISKEGHEFIVDYGCACVSKLIKTTLEGGGKEGVHVVDGNRITFEDIPTDVLEKAIQYFYYKTRYDNDPDRRPKFEVPPMMALQLMMAAKTLQC